ncbi:cytochrome c oxidase subunit 5b-like [Olea europaea subsp. europaea]|uniref:Cytochrome c oxidase subunit 5b-like n=1 Tax=Olea europaea subsp. europaea TaxID=158383 RepID=A0A8S0PLR8_OLEEU|nr:cytochrome c oxidase subunit 5b-like [Olea europaea subsp. europaea]
MWRRLFFKLRTSAPIRSTPRNTQRTSSPVQAPVRQSFPIICRQFSAESGNVTAKKRVEDVMPIATGHEREELAAELEGKDLLEINHPAGPFGSKQEPAVIKSYYDKRIVGCPGAEGEDEHDVVWFWLEKGKPHECPVCSQYFVVNT